MKKLLLIAVAIGFAAFVNAQTNQFKNRDMTPVKKNLTPAQQIPGCQEKPSNNIAPYKDINNATFVTFTSSLNGNTLLSGKKISADQLTKTVLYTSRAGGIWGGTGDDVKLKMTNNYGTSFDSVFFTNGIAHRFPGGTLFNNGTDLYSVSSGAIITGGTTFSANYIFSAKIDGTQAFDTAIPYPHGVGLFHMNELTPLTSGELFILGEKNDSTSKYNHIDYTIWKLKWNATSDKFNFVSSYSFTPLLSKTMPPVQPFGMAFAKDGSVGYFWVNAEDSVTHPNLSTQPLVWKTTDKGTTWNELPIADFSQVQILKDSLWPVHTNMNQIRPLFFYGYTTSEQNMPGTIDAQGNLHLLTNIVGGYSAGPDSLEYTYTAEPSKLFDLYTTSIGWEGRWIDTLATKCDDGTGAIFGDFQIDHRLHIARTDDGIKVFAFWTDSDPLQSTINALPDFKGWGVDINTSYTTGSKNFSINQADMGFYLYMNATDIVLNDGGAYKIPVVVVSNSTTDPTSPILHNYAQGLQFLPTDFVGIKAEAQNINFVAQNYPNPVNGSTTIDVSLNKTSDLSVRITNIIGQTLYEKNLGKATAGNHQVTLDCSKLTTGIYLYTVKAGDNSVTHKMIVE